MRPDRVVMAPPAFYDDLGLAQRVEYFAVEQFVAQACVKTLDVSVLPRASWCDVGGLCTDRCNPCLHRLGDELRPIVGPDMARHTTQDEQIGQHVDHVDGLELTAMQIPVLLICWCWTSRRISETAETEPYRYDRFFSPNAKLRST